MIREPEKKPWFQEAYVWLLISFPLAAVIGGIITTILAVQSDTGLVADDYYKRGMEINRTLERNRSALASGLSINLQYEQSNDKFRFILGANNEFNFPDKLKVSFLNASKAGLDSESTFIRSGKNIYTAVNPNLVRGKWHIIIEDSDWRLLNELSIP